MELTTLWKQRLSNWGCGALTAAMAATGGALMLKVYAALQGHSPFALTASWPLFGATLLVIDVIYYLQHRAEHRVRWLWALHAVHHQSNICDTSVSLRTSMFAPLLIVGVHLLLALAGVPLEVYLPAYALHAALVFLLHWPLPKRFNRAGWLWNSPYLHRAHHSNHPRLRGKNLGGVLIIWDRLFGTFEPNCDDAVTFGVGRETAPLNPLAANLRPFLR